ncbi:MAG: TlpA disulfide reductase family protein [Candidatus Eisenbacteria bacterium]
MRTRPNTCRALVVLAALALLAGCARREAARNDGGSAATPDSLRPPVVALPIADVMARAKAPGAAATLVNVWASWCGPCREEFPALLAAVRRHPGVRLVLVSADWDSELPAVRAFLREQGVTDTSWFKTDADQAFIDGVDPRWSGALPATVVLDANGRQVAFWEGAADSAKFEQALTAALHPSTAGQEGSR